MQTLNTHLHDENKVLPMDNQLKQLTQTQTHPLHDLNAYLNPPRCIGAIGMYWHCITEYNLAANDNTAYAQESRAKLAVEQLAQHFAQCGAFNSETKMITERIRSGYLLNFTDPERIRIRIFICQVIQNLNTTL